LNARAKERKNPIQQGRPKKGGPSSEDGERPPDSPEAEEAGLGDSVRVAEASRNLPEVLRRVPGIAIEYLINIAFRSRRTTMFAISLSALVP
jgi:hypothetical protein